MEVDTDEETNQYLISENLITNYNVKQVEKGDNSAYEEKKVISSYYSPNGDKKFQVKKFITSEEDIGVTPRFEIYYGDEYLFDLLLYWYQGYSWDEFNFRKNRSIKPITWLNNEEVLVLEMNEIYVYNVNTQEKRIFEYPPSINYLYSNDVNEKRSKMVLASRYYLNEEYPSISILNIENQSYKVIFSLKRMSHFTNCVWGLDDDVYFDYINEDNEKIIKRYNSSTEEITDFIENSYVLNSSPDDRYLTYVDEENEVTVIHDLKKDIVLEMPLTEELEWSFLQNQFASVSSNRYINVITINDKEVNINKYDVGDLLNEEESIYNLQFIDNKIRFDVVNFQIYVDGDYNLPVDIRSVVTYEIELQ